MRQRQLGRSGLGVSALGLGCMGMSGSYGPGDEAESAATIHAALEMGVTFFDTADVYGAGHNEELVGRTLRLSRHRVIIATKFGNVFSADGQSRGINGSADYIRQACDASLRRLGVDVIDLYYQHRVDAATPIEETVGAMAGLVKAGKVRYLGLSEPGAGTIRRAHAVHPIAAVQSEYSLWTRDPERDVLATCRELGIGFVPYSPLGRGFLTAALRSPDDLPAGDRRRVHPRFQPENFARNQALATRLREAAGRMGCTPAQLALAWVLAKGEDLVPIPGAKRRAHLIENLAAHEVRLTAADVQALDEMAPPGVAAGDRYPPEGMKALNR